MSNAALKRKVSAQALRKREASYRFLFDNMLSGFAYHKMVFDDHEKPIDYIFLEINAAFERLIGLKKENIIGKRATDVFPGIENEAADWLGIYGRVALTGKPIRFENYSDITKGWYSVSAYSSEKGYFASVFEDITERRQHEESLRQSELKFRILANDSYDMEFWIDSEGRYVFISPSCKRITGYDPKDFIKDPELQRKMIHPEDLPLFDAHLKQEILHPREIDFRIICADGSVRWVSHGCRRIFDGEGLCLGIRGNNRDITERKHAEILSQALNNISLIINSTLDFDETMNQAVTEACKAMGVESAVVSLRKGDNKWYAAYAHGFPSAIIGTEITDEEDPHALLAIKTKQVIVINDAFNDKRVNIEHMRRYNVRSVIVIPLLTKDKSIGVLFLNNHTALPAFTKAQIDFAAKLGYSLSLALENTTLLKAEKDRKERFQLLSETATGLLESDNPQETVNALCLRVMTHLDCHAFLNYLVDAENQRLHLNTYAGIPEKTAREIEWLDYGVAACGCAAWDACRIVAEDIPNRLGLRTDLVKSLGIKAYACHPLTVAGRVIGTLSFGTRTRTTFTEEDLSLMKTVADQVAIATEGKRLIEALAQSRNDLEAKAKEGTAELAKAYELLERVFSNVDISLAYMNRDFNFVRVNRAYAKASGRKADFYAGKNHFALFPNAENERIFDKVVKTGKPYFAYAQPLEYSRHPEREVTYWDWSLQPVKEPDGSVGGVVLSQMDVTERVRAQNAVSAERQRFNDVLEHLPVYVALLTPDYHISFANRSFRERFGKSSGLRCFEHLFGRSEPCEFCETYKVLKTTTPHEWEWNGPDGRIYSVFDFPFVDTDGVTSILEMGIDITKSKQAEEALRNASLYARNLIEASLDPLVTISADGKILDVNRATELTTGTPREELIGSDFSLYFTEPEKAGDGYRRVFKEGSIKNYPLTICHKSGRLTDVLYNAAVYRNEAGVVQGVFAAARDITELKNTAEALRNISLYTRNLIEVSIDPLITISADGKILDVNRATELATGVPREELVGSDFSDYFTEPEKARDGYLRVFEEGSVKDYPLTIRHKSGNLTEVFYNAVIYRNEAGVVQGVFAAARDITEFKKTEKELREKESQIRLFASQILTAHETERRKIAAELHDGIGSSLAGIKFRIERIVRDMEQGHYSAQSLKDLSSNVAQSIGEVRQIMADLRPSILDDFGIIPALGWFCREYKKTYSHINVEEQLGISDDEVPDSLKTMVYRISQEAMNNIAKHSKASQVKLSLLKTGGGIELTIEDNGCGFQVKEIAKGVGLSTMRERAELSGGALDVQSIEGKGTIIRASWPITL
jgi:PAS domain S-box-containing protein